MSTGIAEQYVDLGHFNIFEPRNEKGEWEKALSPDSLLGGHVMRQDTDHDRAVITYGDPFTADHVVTYVPGVGDAAGVPGELKRVRNLKKAMEAQGKGSTAVIYWHGYRTPPSPLAATSAIDARDAGRKLAYFQDTLRYRNPHAHLTVMGHSYGTLVAGEAIKQHQMEKDDLILVASPGTTAHKASELGDPSHVYAATNILDPIKPVALSPRFGKDPSDLTFGATVLKVEHQHTGEKIVKRGHIHGEYWDEGTSILKSMAKIATTRTRQHAIANTIGAQLGLIDLSWRDAWRHEKRGYHGRWVKSWEPGSSPPWEETEHRLDAALKAGERREHAPGAKAAKGIQHAFGVSADTAMVTMRDGSHWVRKANMEFHDPEREMLTSRVSAVIGAGAPPVVIRHERHTKQVGEVLWEPVVPDAQPAIVWAGVTDIHDPQPKRDPMPLFNSDQGVRIGIMDAMTANRDRHPGNWMVRDEPGIGEIPVPIDHGWTFDHDDEGTPRGKGMALEDGYKGRYGDFAKNILTHPELLGQIPQEQWDKWRQNLRQLSPAFHENGYDEGYASMMDNFTAMERLAREHRSAT